MRNHNFSLYAKGPGWRAPYLGKRNAAFPGTYRIGGLRRGIAQETLHTRMMKGGVVLALLFAGLALCEAGALDLDILHVNDHHSHVEEDDFTMDTSGVLTDIPEVDVVYGGFARIVTMMNDMVAANPNTLKLHAGDAITGTLWYSIFKGVADAAVMGKACFDAFALGDHEFDDGDSVLADFLNELESTTGSCPGGPTKVLAANVVPGQDSRLRTENLLLASHTFTVGGEKVGVVGIDIAQKTMDSSSPSPGTILTDEVTAAQAEINTLKAAGIDKIILLTHVGYWKDMSFAQQVVRRCGHFGLFFEYALMRHV